MKKIFIVLPTIILSACSDKAESPEESLRKFHEYDSKGDMLSVINKVAYDPDEVLKNRFEGYSKSGFEKITENTKNKAKLLSSMRIVGKECYGTNDISQHVKLPKEWIDDIQEACVLEAKFEGDERTNTYKFVRVESGWKIVLGY